MSKINVQLQIRSRSFVEISNMLLEGVVFDIDTTDRQQVENLQRLFSQAIKARLDNCPWNDFFFSTVDEEGNLIDAI